MLRANILIRKYLFFSILKLFSKDFEKLDYEELALEKEALLQNIIKELRFSWCNCEMMVSKNNRRTIN